jgi:phage terminase Nu1 subunit (DNA packaging protein)
MSKPPTQAEVAAALDLSVRNLREHYARGTIPKGAPIDEQRLAYIRRLRDVAANRAPVGDLDPAQEKARLDKLRADEVETRLAAARRELIPAADFERHMAAAFKAVAQTLESLPDVLERDAGLDGAAVERCQSVIDRVRDDLYQRLASAKP